MGMFDSLFVPCPSCGEDIEFQSKAGACGLNKYRLYMRIPLKIIADLEGDTQECSCGEIITLGIPKLIPFVVKADLSEDDDGY